VGQDLQEGQTFPTFPKPKAKWEERECDLEPLIFGHFLILLPTFPTFPTHIALCAGATPSPPLTSSPPQVIAIKPSWSGKIGKKPVFGPYPVAFARVFLCPVVWEGLGRLGRSHRAAHSPLPLELASLPTHPAALTSHHACTIVARGSHPPSALAGHGAEDEGRLFVLHQPAKKFTLARGRPWPSSPPRPSRSSPMASALA
jgi:hypothetical protein